MFYHLHVHSDYSLQRSIAKIPELVQKAVRMEQDALALTDMGNLFGAMEFVNVCKTAGIKAIIGLELFLTRTGLTTKNIHPFDEHESLIILAKSDEGYKNLRILASEGYTQGFYYEPRINPELLKEYSSDLVCIIPQNSNMLARYLEQEQDDHAHTLFEEYRDCFRDELYIELQNHGLYQENELNKKLASFAKQKGCPVVAGNSAYFLEREDYMAYETYRSSSQKRSQDLINENYFFCDQDHMYSMLSEYPEAITNTVDVVTRCNYHHHYIGPQLPFFTIPDSFENQNTYLRHISKKRFEILYPQATKEIHDRLEYELSVIESMNYSGYMLIVWDIIEFARSQDIPIGLGRGSAAGSLVAYCLGITGIDPIRYGLIFERFLNPERISMPDIDTDFCFDRRQSIIEYIREKYHDSHVGQIITFSILKPRGALRDVGRALNIPMETINEISKILPETAKNIEEAFAVEPLLQKYQGEEYEELFFLTDRLLGTHRHASLHAAGVVIGVKPLIEFVPLYKDPKSGLIATQYSMNYLEECGLVKMDILGLRTVTIIDKTQKCIQSQSPEFTIDDVSQDDSETFKMLSNGHSESVFQFESPGMKKALKKVKPSRIEHLTALNALYRPGPMEHIDTYADVKNGKRKAHYLMPELKEILEDTYGIIVYQEQVLMIAQKIANYSLGSADLLRSAMGKKKQKEMQEQLEHFISGATALGHSEKEARDIFSLLIPFAGYGFNKSHATAYALLAYRTAYLKLHHTSAYYASLFNCISGHPDTLAEQLIAAKNFGLRVLPPDINRSDYEFTTHEGAVRFGLKAIKTIPENMKRFIPLERKKNGDYTSVYDFMERLPERRYLGTIYETAVYSGLFDYFGDTREYLIKHKNTIVAKGLAMQQARLDNQTLLFSDQDEIDNNNKNENSQNETSNNTNNETNNKEHIDTKPPNSTDDDTMDNKTQHYELSLSMLEYEREFLGTYVSGHPLKHYQSLINTSCTTTIKQIEEGKIAKKDSRKKQYLIAYVDKVRSKIGKNAQKRFFGRMQDETGMLEFSHTYRSEEELIPKERTVYGFIGKCGSFNENAVFFTDKIVLPETLESHYHNDLNSPPLLSSLPAKEITIILSNLERNNSTAQFKAEQKRLKEFLLETAGIQTRVYLILHDTRIVLPPPYAIDARVETVDTLKKMPAVKDVLVVN